MAHLQYMPGDPRLVDQLVYELKSKGIFDQFRKDCIADVDTRPAYQNLRQRVESSVSTFLSRQCWKPDLNKNQLREKLRKHILDGNYLEQGVERIVDQVVNPKVASVFIPQVEDLVYNYLGITRKKSVSAETSNEAVDLLPTDLEAVSPGSVKSNDDKDDENKGEIKMDVDEDSKQDIKDDSMTIETDAEKLEIPDSSSVIEVKSDPELSMDNSIPLPAGEIKPEDIVPPKNSPTKEIKLPGELLPSDIPLPDEIRKAEKELYFKPITSEDDSSSDSSLRRNMSPLTPVRNFENENSCDAQQGFDNDSIEKVEEKNTQNSFKFDIEAKTSDSSDVKVEKKEEQALSYQFNNQININTYNMYEESSNSNNLLIDYESDANSKTTHNETKPDVEQNSEDKKEKKVEEKKSSHKSSHRSRDSHRQSSSKDKRSDSKHSSRDSSRQDKKSSKDDSKTKSNDKDKQKNKSEKQDNKDSRHKSSHKSSSHRDSKSHRSSSSSHRHSSKHSDDKKSSSSKDKSEKSSDKSSKDRASRDSKSSSHRSDKDRKSSSKKHDEKDKKEKKETDDHYSLSGRNNNNRRSTDRDSNDGSSSSKGSNNRTSNSKSLDAKKDSKSGSSKSEPTSNSSDNTSPSDKEKVVKEANQSPKMCTQSKPIVRVDTHLEIPFASPPRLPFVPDVTIKKPKYAANMEEAKRLMKMRKFMEDEQKRMNQEAALLLEFQANVRPSLSQVYSSIPGPELEFACVQHVETATERNQEVVEEPTDSITQALTEMHDGSDIQNVPSEYVDEVNNTSIEAQLTGVDDLKDVIETDEITIVELDTLDKTDEENLAVNLPEESKMNDNVSNAQVIEDNDVSSMIITREFSNPESTEVSTNTDDKPLKYFPEHEKVNAELERDKFSSFLKSFTEKNQNNKMYLINCDTYEENILKEVAENFGSYEIVNYFRNGHLKLAKPKNVKVNVSTEINLPLDNESLTRRSTVFSPVKSECSFELSSEYDAMDDIMTKTSRQQIMEIILGNATVDEMPTTIVYCNESNIEDNSLKRKHKECSVNNNRTVLTPNKIRKISESDQITSTTEEVVAPLNNNQILNNFRSKYLGKARRVGLSRPKKISLPNSPSSDKSVENYENSTGILSTPNGKIKTPRNKVQRYATTDLYKPKLHYLSRRNNIT